MTQPTFSGRVMAELMKGFGVEDIAITLNCTVDLVRLEIKRLRESGKLDELLTKNEGKS